MVRWLNSPAVMGVLIMLALLGVYIEFSTPGFGLPGLVAVICFAVIIGSKYLVGLANWVEVALFVVGVLLLMVEIFILPGFGIAGFTGILCILVGLFGMLIKNPPNKFPWPQTQYDWQLFTNGALGLLFGFFGFVLLAWLVTKHLPKIPVAKRIMLAAPRQAVVIGMGDSWVAARPSEEPIQVGQKGISLSQLRPAGKAKFGGLRVDVVSSGGLIEANREIVVEVVEGNRIVVKEIPKPKNIV
jgi:membrane-bound serine protease (ClpP class)